MALLHSLVPKQKQKKLPRISIALELIEWVRNGCLARVILIIKRDKNIPLITDTIITKYF
jgi:hypothetical protein